jgi:hypothetical protein
MMRPYSINRQRLNRTAKGRTELARQRAAMQESLYKENISSVKKTSHQSGCAARQQEDVFEQEKSIHALHRSHDQLDSDLHKIRADSAFAPSTLRTQLANNDKAIFDIKVQLAENGYVRDTVVRATIWSARSFVPGGLLVQRVYNQRTC